MNMVHTAINMKNFLNASNYVQKSLSIPNLDEVQRAMAQAAYGLVNLENRLYKEAARAFLEVTNHISGHFNFVIADADIAVYMGLCALATFERDELRSKVMGSTSFKYFLSLQPEIGKAVTAMVNCDYVELIRIIGNYREQLKFDLYIGENIDGLITDIRSRALLQYFSPFKSSSIALAAQAFNSEVLVIEKELAALIMDGKLQARIDSA
jgi:COP9 signalosome complex subunit 1